MNTKGKLGFFFTYLCLFLSSLGDFSRVNEYELESGIIFLVYLCSYRVLVISFVSMNTKGKLGFFFRYLCLLLSSLGDFFRVNEYEVESGIIFHVSLGCYRVLVTSFV